MWLVRINMTVRNFAHPSATDTGCTRQHLRSSLKKSAIIIFTVYLYTLVVSGLPRAIISDLMTNTGEGVIGWQCGGGGWNPRTCGRGVQILHSRSHAKQPAIFVFCNTGALRNKVVKIVYCSAFIQVCAA